MCLIKEASLTKATNAVWWYFRDTNSDTTQGVQMMVRIARRPTALRWMAELVE